MPATPAAQHELPLPIAALVRFAGNAKSAKDRHDAAHRAWEASIQLAVAARPPADRAPLVRGSLGHWVAALPHAADAAAAIDSPPLLEAFSLFAEVGTGRKPTPSKIAARTLFELFPAYRNAVIGHAGVRSAEFYDRAAGVLLEGLISAWSLGLFLPSNARLIYVESIEIESNGSRRGRLLDLTGLATFVVDPSGTRDLSEDLLPRRVYLRDGPRFRPLHPLVLFHEEERHERVFFFAGLGRKPDFLDYAGGERLGERDRRTAFPDLESEVRSFFGSAGSGPDKSTDSESGAANRFGDYEILGRLGEGGMGVVYLARQVPLRRLVALKMLPAETARDPVRLARFRREIAALARCDHANVVKIFASGETNGTPYFSMEYVDGPDLKAVAGVLADSGDFHSAVSTAAETAKKERESLFDDVPDLARRAHDIASAVPGRPKDRYRQLARVFSDAARGVQELHEQGIIHRDLKPENLMVTAADHRVVVMDLGLAALKDASRSITKDRDAIIGTLRYMPPEQLDRSAHPVDERADVYSLGATLYELLARRPLFDGETEVRLRGQVLNERAAPLRKLDTSVPKDLATIVHKAIEKDPRARYATAVDMARDLDAFAGTRRIAAKPHGAFYPLAVWARENKGWAATIVVAFLALIAALVLVNSARETLRTESLRFSDYGAARFLVEKASRLWPADSSDPMQMRTWIEETKDLTSRLDSHRERVQQLRSKARPYTDAERAADKETHPDYREFAALTAEIIESQQNLKKLETEGRVADDLGVSVEEIRSVIAACEKRVGEIGPRLSERQTWRFDSARDQFQHEFLVELITQLEQLLEADDGWTSVTIASMERRLQFAQALRARTIDEHRAVWDKAIADIRSSPKYGGLVLSPQEGLVPIGQDPDSGLFEFWHFQSGERPARDSRGHVVPSDAMGIVLVLVPPGTFLMGSPKDERSRGDDEGPQRDVSLDAYFISKYEMTQGQWERHASQNPSYYSPTQMVGPRPATLLNPVENVSWETSRRVLFELGLELPTEAQWERAARGGTSTAWWTGAERESLRGRANIADKSALDAGAPWVESKDWPDNDDGHIVHSPVGTYPANPFGLHDTIGNLWEWCRDQYGAYSLPVKPGDGERQTPRDSFPVSRGGAFNQSAWVARSAFRANATGSAPAADRGVRPARRVNP